MEEFDSMTWDAIARHYRAMGRSTSRANIHAAEDGVIRAYRLTGLPAPMRFRWYPSPMAIARMIYGSEVDLALESVLGMVYRRPRQRAYDVIRSYLRPENDPALAKAFRDAKRSIIGEGIIGKIILAIGREVQEPIPWAFGQHDAAWLALYEYLVQRHPEVKSELKVLDGIRQVARYAGWYVPLEDVCLMTDRPTFLSFDTAHRLHNPYQMSVRYGDGWGIYALHGTIMEPWQIETPIERIPVTRILCLRHALQRKRLLQRVGPERIRDDIRPYIIDQQEGRTLIKVPAEQTYALYRHDLTNEARCFILYEDQGQDELVIRRCKEVVQTLSQAQASCDEDIRIPNRVNAEEEMIYV